MKKIEVYKKMVKEYWDKSYALLGEGFGYAIDGPIDPERWFLDNNKLKVLFLLKEAYGYEDDDLYQIMEFTDGYNAAKTNRVITRLSFVLDKVYQVIKAEKTTTISDLDLFQKMDPVIDEMRSKIIHEIKDSYLDIAILEIKKISGESKSSDSDIREHSIKNAGLLTKQILFLEPDVIICGGPIAWKCLTEDLDVFEKRIFSSKESGVFKERGIIVSNSYHPSYSGFNSYDIIFDILKASID